MKRFVSTFLFITILLALTATSFASCEQFIPVFEYYYASMLYDTMQIDSSLVIADPFHDCINIAIKVSFPFNFPNDDIAFFRVYINDKSYDLEMNRYICTEIEAHSIFSGLIPLNNNLENLRIIPVGMKEMEEWCPYEITFSDYKKIE